MTMQERYEDICERCGYTETVVRSVIKAVRESCLNSLKHGERAVVPGICSLEPMMKDTIINGRIERRGDVKASEAVALRNSMKEVKRFERIDRTKTAEEIEREEKELLLNTVGNRTMYEYEAHVVSEEISALV